MKRFCTSILVLVATAALGLLPLSPEQPSLAQDQSDKPQAIPKDSVYTTSPEKGLKAQLVAAFEPDKGGKEKPLFPYSFDLRRLHRESAGMGASNVFLVTGENIADAVSSTYWSFHLGICDEPAGPDIGGKQKSHKHWLVAYLGIGQGTPPQWLFQAATIQRQTLEVRYTKPQYAKAGADKIGFFYWVPLPQLKAGTYEVKLIDADKDRVMLTRWVSVR